MRVCIGYIDGRYSFQRMSEHAPPNEYEIDVPESTVVMWEAAQELDRAVQAQLLSLDCDRILDEEDEG